MGNIPFVIFQQPFHKRLLSRVAFYSGVMAFLWFSNLMQERELQAAQAAMHIQEAEVTEIESFLLEPWRSVAEGRMTLEEAAKLVAGGPAPDALAN